MLKDYQCDQDQYIKIQQFINMMIIRYVLNQCELNEEQLRNRQLIQQLHFYLKNSQASFQGNSKPSKVLITDRRDIVAGLSKARRIVIENDLSENLAKQNEIIITYL